MYRQSSVGSIRHLLYEPSMNRGKSKLDAEPTSVVYSDFSRDLLEYGYHLSAL